MINLFEEYISNSRIYNEASFAQGAIDKIINNFLKVVGKRAGLAGDAGAAGKRQ